MITVTAALLVAFIPQDEGRLKEAWPKFVDAWKAIDAYKLDADATFFDDAFLAVVAKLHSAFESAGLQAGDGEYLSGALKALLKVRSRDLLGPGLFFTKSGTISFKRARVLFDASHKEGKTDPMADLIALLKKPKDADAKAAEADVAKAHELLSRLSITAHDTREALRGRALRLIQALILGEPYPEPRALSEEQSKHCRAWIADLGHEEIVRRDHAMKELARAEEGSLSLLREALKSGHAEVMGASRRLLGFDHTPWKGKLQVKFVEFDDVVVEPSPAEEKPK